MFVNTQIDSSRPDYQKIVMVYPGSNSHSLPS
jgi:hypothetical protein